MRTLLFELQEAIRGSIAGARDAKRILGKGHSGDVQFAIDELAEQALRDFCRKRKISYYSEAQGLVKFEKRPEYFVIADPIDGTRPAAAGLESATISLAIAPYSKDAVLGDVTHALIRELRSERIFYAERGKGARIIEGEKERVPALSSNTDTDSLFFSFEVCGRPVEAMAHALGGIINACSFRGGVFVFNSATFAITRLLTAQLDAYIDAGDRVFRDAPRLRSAFLKAAHGNVMGLQPHDIAAALLIAREARAAITDCYGKPLGDMLLADASAGNLRSCLAAGNKKLHGKLLKEIENAMTTRNAF